MNKNFWTKLSKEFNEYAAKDGYKNPRALSLEYTGFFKGHIGLRGLNHNESSLLEFSTKIIEANGIHFAYNAKYQSLTLYVNASVHSEEAGTYIEVTKDGKTHDFRLYDREDRRNDRLGNLLGVKDLDTDLFQHYAQEELKDLLVKKGFKILVFFRFTLEIRAALPHMNFGIGSNRYFRTKKNGIELGWISTGTYNSLPFVLKIKKVRSIPVVKLSDLGIEGRGYYSHDLRCSIPKGQAKQAKRFFNSVLKAELRKRA